MPFDIDAAHRNPYAFENMVVANAPASERASFIRRTYLHLAGAVLAFALIEVIIFSTVDVAALMQTALGGDYSWLIVLGAFMLVSWIADAWASSRTSIRLQYCGLGLYVVAEAVIFAPLLYMASHYGGADVIPAAAIITGFMFTALSAIVLLTRKDFSFLRGALAIGGFAALGLIVASVIFGFTLGVFFSCLMIAFACGYILYYTSNILHHYQVDQHVSAALALFASVALLFWYVIRLLMSLSRE